MSRPFLSMQSLLSLIRAARFFAVVAVLLALHTQAHAGWWQLDHYVWSGTAKSTELHFTPSRDVYNSQLRKSTTTERDGKIIPGVGKSPDHPQSATASAGYGGNTYSGPGYTNYTNTSLPTANSSVDSTVYAVMKWHRNELYDDDYYHKHDDPNDNPPSSLYVSETVHIQGNRSIFMSGGSIAAYDYDNGPWSGNCVQAQGHIGSGDLSCSIKDSDWTYGRNYSIMGASYGYGARVTKTAIKRLKVSGDTVKVPSVSMGSTTSVSSGYEKEASSANGGVWFGYDVKPITFAVLARLKGDHNSSDLQTDYNYDPQYGSSASIAAGGFTTDKHEHEADIALQVMTPGGWGGLQPVANTKIDDLPKMKIANEKGVDKTASITAPDTPATQTDSNGRIYMGSVMSRDLTSVFDKPVVVYPKDVVGTGATINHQWASVQWKMGQNGEKDWNPNFIEAGSDYKEWAWTKLTFAPDKPLTKHKFKFLVDYLEVQVTDPETELTTTKIFTTDPTQATQHAGDAAYQVIYKPDVTSLTSDYITPPSEGECDDQGVVKGEFTVKSGDLFKVNSYRFALEDQGVYIK